MNFAADPLCVSQRDEAAPLGLFHERVAGYRCMSGAGYRSSRKVVLAQEEGCAAPGPAQQRAPLVSRCRSNSSALEEFPMEFREYCVFEGKASIKKKRN